MQLECPICGWRGDEFLPKNGRRDVLCPHCGSFERHRHQFFAARSVGVFDSLQESTLLHIGSKGCEIALLKEADTCVNLDLQPSRATIVGNIAQAPFADGVFDLVWASHVLEHVECVSAAVAEIYHVLKPDGIAVLDVPMYGTRTVKLAQPDRHGHLWHPGDDWPTLYTRAGFATQLFWGKDCPQFYGPLAGSLVVICRKS